MLAEGLRVPSVKSLEELGRDYRQQTAGEFVSYTRFLMLGLNQSAAARIAEIHRAPPRVLEALQKAPVAATSDGLTAGPKLLVSAFLDALRHESVFMAMLNGGMIRLPFNTMTGSIATAFGASVVQPGMAIPVRKAGLTQGPELVVRKAAALVALSRELLQAGGSAAEALLSRSLRGETAKAVDAEALVILKAGAGTSAATANVETDLETMRVAVSPGSASRLFWIASPAVAALLAGLTASGAYRYPTVTWTGGTLKGVPLLVTDQAAAGELLLVDAAGLVGNADNVELVASDSATLQMDSAPTQSVGVVGSPQEPVHSTGVSMLQTNTRAVRCILYFGLEKVRATAVRVLTGIACTST
jgi:HK97 family phage major capsid protein